LNQLISSHTPGKIKVNYEPVVLIGAVRQTARVVGIRRTPAKVPTSSPSPPPPTASTDKEEVTADVPDPIREEGPTATERSKDEDQFLSTGDRAMCR
jgi:hypothetical protein